MIINAMYGIINGMPIYQFSVSLNRKADNMMNMGISIALDRLPEAERKAKEAAKAAGVEQETLNRVLERLAALEQDNRRLQADNEKRDVAYEKLAADYTQLKEKYIEETVDRQQPEQAEAEE